MHSEAASRIVQKAIIDLTTLPPDQCVMAAFTVTGMIVGGLAVSHDLPDSELTAIFKLGTKAMHEVVAQTRAQLTGDDI